MSVTFHIIGERHAESGEFALNVSNTNAYAFLAWLGLPNHDPAGSIGAGDLAALLRRPLWPENRRRSDEGRLPRIDIGARGAITVDCGRRPGAFARYAEALLRIADHAGDRDITWG